MWLIQMEDLEGWAVAVHVEPLTLAEGISAKLGWITAVSAQEVCFSPGYAGSAYLHFTIDYLIFFKYAKTYCTNVINDFSEYF